MSCAAKIILKPISMVSNVSSISFPSLFATSKISSCSYPPPSNQLKPLKLSYSASLSLPALFLLKEKGPPLRCSIIPAQELENNPVLLEQQVEGDQDIQGVSDDAVVGQESDGVVEDVGEGDGYVEPPQQPRLYVRKLPYDVDGDRLAELFSEAGVVKTAEVCYKWTTEVSRVFGYVTMGTMEEAHKAIQMFNGYKMNDRSIDVQMAALRGTKPEIRPRDYKLCVNNLPLHVDDGRLEEVFSEYGKVVSSYIIPDNTGRSLGYGFVVMSSESEMNAAIANLDGKDLDGRSIAIRMVTPKGAHFRRVYKLYVGNLPSDVDGVRLKEVFGEYGQVLSTRVVLDKDSGVSRGFGFVVMSSEAEMNAAMANLDGQDLDGKSIVTRMASPKRSRRSREYTLHVDNLPSDVDGVHLKEVFGEYGQVLSSHVIFDKDTRVSRGFGFVLMSSEAEMKAAIANLDGQNLNGRSIVVQRAVPRLKAKHTLHVSNLPWSMSNGCLEEVFSEHGKVVSSSIVPNRDSRRSSGYGFVVMSSESEMNDAIANLDRKILDGNAIRVTVANGRSSHRSIQSDSNQS